MITADRVRQLFDYNAESGEFTRRIRAGHSRPGEVAGSTNADGYTIVGVDGTTYYAHRLAWLWVHGVLPDEEVDHRDRNRSNNRLDNLRVASSSQNKMNTRLKSDNSYGRGVVRHKNRSRPFQARITIAGKHRSLGYYASPEQAGAAYAAAANENFKEFANTGT